jgi:hypothetical protein
MTYTNNFHFVITKFNTVAKKLATYGVLKNTIPDISIYCFANGKLPLAKLLIKTRLNKIRL